MLMNAVPSLFTTLNTNQVIYWSFLFQNIPNLYSIIANSIISLLWTPLLFSKCVTDVWRQKLSALSLSYYTQIIDCEHCFDSKESRFVVCGSKGLYFFARIIFFKLIGASDTILWEIFFNATVSKDSFLLAKQGMV